MTNISNDIENKINTLRAKYSLVGVSIKIDYDRRYDKISLISVSGNINKFVVPDYIEIVGESCFAYNETLTEVILGESVECIQENAFEYCINLEIVDMRKSHISRIENNAFDNCIKLNNVLFGNASEVSLGHFVFGHCIKLKELIFPNCISEAPFGCCSGCLSLEKVTHSFKKVLDEAFLNTALSNFNFNGISIIGASSFKNTKLKRVCLSDMQYIGDEAFSENVIDYVYLDNIDNLKIESQDISSGIFSNCKIQTVEFKDSCNIIARKMFCDSDINNIKGMQNIRKICYKAFNNASIVNGIDITTTISIGDSAFEDVKYNWEGVYTIGGSKGVSIGEKAFKNTVLDHIVINNARIIDYGAFINSTIINLTINKAMEIRDIFESKESSTDTLMVRLGTLTKGIKGNYKSCKLTLLNVDTISKSLLDKFNANYNL